MAPLSCPTVFSHPMFFTRFNVQLMYIQMFCHASHALFPPPFSDTRFTDAGYASLRARPQTIGHTVFLPDPMETMFVIQTKVGSTPVTSRRFVDLPGTNVMRGLSGLSLKSPEEHHIFVAKPVAEMICKNMGSAIDEVTSELDSGDPEESGDAKHGTPLWPFSSGIDLCREMLNLYSTGPTALVNFTGGFGQWELACLHDGVTCSSFVTGVRHREAGHNIRKLDSVGVT